MSIALRYLFRPWPNILSSFPRKRESSPAPHLLDSRFRGNDDRSGGDSGRQQIKSHAASWMGDTTNENTRPSGGHSPWDG